MSDRARHAWAESYIKQCRSDWAVFDLLMGSDCPLCHKLHYLQMLCEKLAKAYRFRDSMTSIDDLLTSHSGFVKFVNALFCSAYYKEKYAGKADALSSVKSKASQLARLIELMAPAVGREYHPENSEYPWATGEEIVAPCEYEFPLQRAIFERKNIFFLRAIKDAIFNFENISV